MQVAVTDILWSGPSAVIFSGATQDGSRLIVRLQERLRPVPGEVYDVEGTETRYVDRRGNERRQIDARTADRVRTSGALIGPWLRTLPGIGQERAAGLLEHFGNDLLDVLQDASRMEEIGAVLAPARPHLGAKLAALVQARYVGLRSVETVRLCEAEFYARLEEHGVASPAAARSLFRLIGSADAWERLRSHPYAAATVLDWKAADHLGQRLLVARGDVPDPEHHPERLIGACDSAWRRILADGSTAASAPLFLERLRRLGVAPERALQAGIEACRVLRHGDLLRAPGAAWLERRVARDLCRLAEAQATLPAGVAERIARWRGPQGQRLTEEQGRVVLEMLGRSVAVLQGGAGTGKTTTMRVLVNVWEAARGKALLAALSGKAALRLARSTGRPALTLARLVAGLERRSRLSQEGLPVREDLPSIDARTMLVVDESSMVDLATWHRVLRFLPTGARLVLVGDVAQLPPVGLGRVFHDLVDEGRVVSRLTRTLRQAESNPIVTAALAVRAGDVPALPGYAGAQRGVQFLECASEAVEGALRRVRADFLEAGTPAAEILVLAALNRTCRTFNQLMQQEREEAGAAGIRLGPLAPFVSVGDPVIATMNRQEEALANGLTGWLASLDPPLVRFEGEDGARRLSAEALAELASAWGISGHRSQGSEAQRVVVALDGQDMMTREWLYTAITRGKEQVVLVGRRRALNAAVGRRSRRMSGFPIERAISGDVGDQP